MVILLKQNGNRGEVWSPSNVTIHISCCFHYFTFHINVIMHITRNCTFIKMKT